MQVVNITDGIVGFAQGGFHRGGIQPLGYALQQNVRRAAQQPPGTAKQQHRHDQRQRGIGPQPAEPAYGQRRTHRRQRAEQIAQHVQACAGHVHVIVRVAVQRAQDHRVDQQAGDRHAQHQPRKDRRRMPQANNGLVDDPAHQRELAQRVDEAHQDFDPAVTVTASCIGGAHCHPRTDEGQQQCQRIHRHVAGVGQQRQRAGPPAADDFHQRHRHGQAQRPHQFSAAVRGHGVRVIVIVCVAVIVGVRVAHAPMLESGPAVTQSLSPPARELEESPALSARTGDHAHGHRCGGHGGD